MRTNTRLKGADLLLYPTAIGDEPSDVVDSPNTPKMWQNVMIARYSKLLLSSCS